MKAVTAAIRAARRVVTLLGVTLALTGCDQVVQAVLGIEYPTGLTASDGTYRDRIILSWIGVSQTDANGVPRTLAYYLVERDNVAIDTVSGTTYTDAGPFEIGRIYRYRVQAIYTDAPASLFSSVETGYVMDARSILIHHVPFTYSYTVDDGDWLDFPAQEGWTYRVYATGGASPIRLLRSGDLVEAGAPGDGAPSGGSDLYGTYLRYTTDSSRLYYLQLGGSGTVSIVHE